MLLIWLMSFQFFAFRFLAITVKALSCVSAGFFLHVLVRRSPRPETCRREDSIGTGMGTPSVADCLILGIDFYHRWFGEECGMSILSRTRQAFT